MTPNLKNLLCTLFFSFYLTQTIIRYTSQSYNSIVVLMLPIAHINGFINKKYYWFNLRQ